MYFNFIDYLDDMRRFFRPSSDLRGFVASTSKRRKKKPSWNTRKKKRKWPPYTNRNGQIQKKYH